VKLKRSKKCYQKFINKNRAIKEFQNIDHVITVTQVTSNNLEQNYGVIASKISIISPAIEQNEYSETDFDLLKEFSNNDLILVNLGQPSLTKETELIPQIANAFIITSREESFSLLGVQAAMLKKPIINFKNAIGLSEILTEQVTFTANYLDTCDFADKILELYNFPEILHQKTSLSKQIYAEKLEPSICNKNII